MGSLFSSSDKWFLDACPKGLSVTRRHQEKTTRMGVSECTTKSVKQCETDFVSAICLFFHPQILSKNPIYEPIFIENSFGFRPRKKADDAIKANYNILKDDKRPFVVEIDL
ncbi:MAG: hypothetical protein EBU03_05320, partial [Methylophilaceae bacterium]|nr:hypothetical protein [Methylophilaceae bacterium]